MTRCTIGGMLKADVLNLFGTLQATAKALGISKSGVWMWPRVVPKGRAYELQAITRGKLRVNPALYRSGKDAKGEGSKPKRKRSRRTAVKATRH